MVQTEGFHMKQSGFALARSTEANISMDGTGEA